MPLHRLTSCAVTIACALILAACGGGGGGGTTTTQDSAVAAASAQLVQAVIGGSTPVTVSFTSSDGKPITNVQVTTDLTKLPAGWSATAANFTCSQATTGNGCVLTLTYAPTTASNGTLTIGYSYTNNAGESETGTFSVPYTSTTHDNVIATAAPLAPYAVIVGTGASSAVSVYFTTDDGNPATNLQVTTSLSGLPDGWTGPASFSCATVSTGNGCALALTFKPTVVASGTLSINYSYSDNSGTAKTGTVSLPFASTSHNHVVGTPSPSGPISVAYPTGSKVVTIGFATDDGNPATNVVVTSNLAALPAGWTSTASSFSCASVASGNGCQLQLKYAPSAAATNLVLPITYSYTDDSGTPGNTGTVNITYSSTNGNNAVTAVSPVSPVTTIAGGAGLPVTVTFTTDDQNPATGLTITGPATLPTYWTGTISSFTCATFSTGNGCQLALTYAPTAANSGTLQLTYSYTSGSGATKTGTVSIAYSATTHDTAAITYSPTGQIAVVKGGTAQPVTITFNSSDANSLTNLSVTSGLSTLPSGWTGPATFTCATVASTGSACQLSLSFAPTTVVSGTLAIGYGYTDNAGTAQTGTASVQYATTSNNNVVNVVAPTSPIAVSTYTPTTVTVTFNTDDANPATALSVTATGTSSLATLPTGWTGPTAGTFTCATVANTGTGCQLSLTYSPTTVSSGTVTLGYAYTSDSSAAKTGTITIAYSSVVGHIYVADGDDNPTVGTTITDESTDSIWRCAISASTGAVSGCTKTYTLTGLDPRGVVLNGNYAYIASGGAGVSVGGVYVCPVNADGSFGTNSANPSAAACAESSAPGTLVNSPHGVAVNGGFLYIVNGGSAADPVTVCTISTADGSLSSCVATATSAAFNSPEVIAFSGSVAYVADEAYDGSTTTPVTTQGSVVSCTVNSDGTLTACAVAAAGASAATTGVPLLPTQGPVALTVNGTSLFVGTFFGNAVCTIGTGGALSACAATGPSEASAGYDSAYGIAFANGYAYIDAHNDGLLLVCQPPNVTSISTNCAAATSPGFTNPVGLTAN